MGRYTLTVDDKEVQGYVKADLRKIDRFTSHFAGEDELLKRLNLNGKVSINYNHNGLKKLKIAYEDKSLLSLITYLETRKIDIGNSAFREQVQKILDRVLEDEQFYWFIFRTRLINNRIKEAIKEYISAKKFCNPDIWEDTQNLNEKLQIVFKSLSEYLQFRNLLFIEGEYEGYLAEMEAVRLQEEALEAARERELEEKFKHQEEFFTAEDYPKHKEYILTHNIPVPDSMKDKIDDL